MLLLTNMLQEQASLKARMDVSLLFGVYENPAGTEDPVVFSAVIY